MSPTTGDHATIRSDRPEISVVVPTYRRPERLPALLDALAAQTIGAGRFEVVIVDDCSGDGTLAWLEAERLETPFPLRALTTQTNGGPAAARNTGWRSALAPVVAFTDDDCLPEPGWLAAGLAAFADPDVGVVQGRTRAPEGVSVHRLTDWYLWRIVEGPDPYFEGCNIFYRFEALRRGDGFDEPIRWWGEDTALGWSVLGAGWHRAFAADAVVVHAVERRGWAWFVRNGLAEANLVTLAARHPDYRAEAFWRPWAYRREDAAFVLAAAGGLLATRWRVAAVAALPYLWWRRPSIRQRSFPRLCVQIPVVDAARCAGHLHGSLRNRILVL